MRQNTFSRIQLTLHVGYPTYHERLPFFAGCGMVWQRVPFGQVGSPPVKSLSGNVLKEDYSCSLQPLTGKLYTYFNSKVTRTLRPSWQS